MNSKEHGVDPTRFPGPRSELRYRGGHRDSKEHGVDLTDFQKLDIGLEAELVRCSPLYWCRAVQRRSSASKSMSSSSSTLELLGAPRACPRTQLAQAGSPRARCRPRYRGGHRGSKEHGVDPARCPGPRSELRYREGHRGSKEHGVDLTDFQKLDVGLGVGREPSGSSRLGGPVWRPPAR